MIVEKRVTKETDISVGVDINGTGASNVSTGVGFFDHMLEALSKHSLIDMEIKAVGDLHIDAHHTVEDVGIVLGQALNRAIYPIEGVERYGDAIAVMDEAAISCALDLSNRPFLVYKSISEGKVGEFDIELVEEFFRAFAFNARITLHLNLIDGKNSHHIIEATFKALALALRRALAKNKRVGLPSTKGLL